MQTAAATVAVGIIKAANSKRITQFGARTAYLLVAIVAISDVATGLATVTACFSRGEMAEGDIGKRDKFPS